MLMFECAGCGARIAASTDCALPFACPEAAAGGDADHVLRLAGPVVAAFPSDRSANPFVRYRTLLASHALAEDLGVGDDRFVSIVRGLDGAIAGVDGKGFETTPFGRAAELGRRIGLAGGEVWVKDETGNVSGSHKARHLAGLMLCLLVRGAAGPDGRASGRPEAGQRLAIASCGNAALAAAVVARAAGRPLDVFVPQTADPAVLGRLARLSAAIHICARGAGARGDPCYAAFRAAVAGGAIPFCCQGSDNGLTIDGGRTLAWEMVSALLDEGGDGAGANPGAGGGASRPRRGLDAVVVQVGGGALASAVTQGFDAALACGAIDRRPRLYTVQTEGAFPLRRAYDAVAERVLARAAAAGERGPIPASDHERAARMTRWPGLVREEMAFARRHRSLFMRPWETEPRSVAHGILDDETYDWAEVAGAMLETGGWPIVVGEGLLVEANRAARECTGVDVDHTGSAGLAGLMRALALDPRLAGERTAIIFSGVRRG